MSEPAVTCSFCGKPEHAVWRLIAGPGVYICSDCVGVCVQILSAESAKRTGNTLRVVSKFPDGTVQRSEHGPLPQLDPADQGKHRWLKQCPACGAWNVGLELTGCLDCGGDFAARRP